MTAPPTPGIPPSAESVKLLKAGDVLIPRSERWPYQDVSPLTFDRLDSQALIVVSQRPDESFFEDRFTFIGRPDAEGWMTWSGGENPVRGYEGRIEIRLRSGDEFTGGNLSKDGTWQHIWGEGDIIAFRLTTPSDQGETADPFGPLDNSQVFTTPASGSDGLETFGWVGAASLDAIRSGSTACLWPVEAVAYHIPLVTREAAEKRIGELDDQLAQAAMLAVSETSKRLAAESQVAALKAALETAKEDILGLLRGRGCEAEGSEEDWIGHIDQALALKEGR